MSSRQLRRLQQQKQLERAQQSSEGNCEAGEDVDEPAEAAPKPRPNLFAALGSEQTEHDDDGDDDDDDEDNGVPLTEPLPTAEPAPSAAKRSKKKKKKKKKTGKTKPAGTNQEANKNAKEDEHEDEDEIDKAIKQLKLGAANTNPGSGKDEPASASMEPRKRMNGLLSVNPHRLRAVNEMRNLFGRDVIESAIAEEQQEQQRSRRRQQTPREVDLETYLREPPGAKKLPEISLRRNVFVQGKDHWPRQSAGGLNMKAIGKSDDGLSTEYAYFYDENYDSLQHVFWAIVQMGDPMRMVHFLKEAPYHVSTLLQVSNVAKQDQNMALAAELCERALFTFGRVTTSAFRQDMEHGRARFDFGRPENRQFWLAGFQYVRSLIRKGTFRTALEWAKLLYSLDPQDPYAMRHYIHLLALRAYDPEWLIEFTEQMALAANHADIVYLRQSLVLAKLQMDDEPGAREILQHGIKTVPWLYCALFQELNLDAPPSIWGIKAQSHSQKFWVTLYIHQTKDLWNNAQATALLRQVAKDLGRVDVASLPLQDAVVDRGVTRLAYLEGHTALLAVAPRRFLDAQPNYEFDPLPPPWEQNIFTAQSTRLPWGRERGRHQGEEAEEEGQGHLADLVARMHNLVARQGVAPGVEEAVARRVGMMGVLNNAADGDDDDDDDDEVRALRAADDEELQRDIEAHMNWGNGQGVLGTLMQMLGVGRRAHDEGGDEEDEGHEEAPLGQEWEEGGR
ncbi:transcription factor 25 [Metarhizium album ARSEF 1941]|uniref:Transcription factor 25 n=1 Tax=Metarhizium album (strain ARSEF 1941) TaxID=1081103 RepID=A0A0B2WYU0_METAS|nr:transcription factor 25 [Metarhizium album ARSEF 1941]KHN99203.1 transcription factor 25 [Metarhizium album ARSEF 1941]